MTLYPESVNRKTTSQQPADKLGGVDATIEMTCLNAGVIALCASAVLTAKIPYTRLDTPGTAAGITLLVGCYAYVAIVFATRRFQR